MTRIEHFAIFAADLHRLKDFYEKAFGLRVVLDNSKAPIPGFFLADDAGVAIEIIGRPESVPPAETRYVCHIAFHVDNIDATRTALEAAGITFETDSAVSNDAMTTYFFNDPEGNRLQIVHRNKPLSG